MKLEIAIISGLMFVAPAIGAQTPPRTMTAAEHVKLGDDEYKNRNVATALRHYQAALKVDSTDYAALCQASRSSSDLGEFDPSAAARDTLFKAAEQYARRAITAKPSDVEGHFALARAIGRRALTMGKRDRVKFAGVVHDEATAALKIDPKHSGALHVLGMWNAEIMRLSGIERFLAKNLLGGSTFGEASWDNAQRDLEEAVAADPSRITHHLDLGLVYRDRGMKDKAREQFDWIAKAPVTEFNDPHYKEQAATALAAMK